MPAFAVPLDLMLFLLAAFIGALAAGLAGFANNQWCFGAGAAALQE